MFCLLLFLAAILTSPVLSVTPDALFELSAKLNFLATLSSSIGAGAGKSVAAFKKAQEEAAQKAREEKELAEKKKEQAKVQVKLPVGARKKIVINNFMQISPELDAVKQMKATKPEEQKARKDKAREYMSALRAFVASKKSTEFTPVRKKQLNDVIYTILDIDPLLILQAVNVLQQAGFTQTDLYDLMVKLYEKRIVFLEQEFAKIKPEKKLYKGVRDDIDEAMGYPVEISPELQAAHIKWDLEKEQSSKKFEDDIEALRKRLLALLREYKNTIEATNKKTEKEEDRIPIEEYINIMAEKPRVYCRMHIKKPSFGKVLVEEQVCDNVYVPFYQDIDSIIDEIEKYKTHAARYTPSIKNHKKQAIINKLQAFITYANAKDFCQICFKNDLSDYMQKHPQFLNDLRKQFAQITAFFEQLPDSEQTEATRLAVKLANQELETLEKKFSEPSEFVY